MTLNSMHRVDGFLQNEVQAVCVLQPYQDQLPNDLPELERANAKLAEIKYHADEGHWALVFLSDQHVDIVKLKRSSDLDLLSKHEINPKIAEALPKAFSSAYCADGARATLTKIKLRDRTYIVLGET